ncbi:MAG: KH domain-containing protein [Nitrososphaerales archaeon]
MSFQKSLRLSLDRLGVLVGKDGSVKNEIEKRCNVSLLIDSKTGEVIINTKGDITRSQPFKAMDIITAIGKGFSPQRAFKLLDEEIVLHIIDLRDYAGKSQNSLERIKGRIIGLKGKSRRLIEELTGAYISVFGHTVSIIGRMEDAKLALDAIDMLASGSAHKTVYNMLQRARTKAKMDRFKLWESNE